MESFLDEVDKTILEEAPPSSWYHPKARDVVTVEVQNEQGSRVDERTWCTDGSTSWQIAGVTADRCVATMRKGEIAEFRARKAEVGSSMVRLKLVAIERREDLLGDGRLLRTVVEEGLGWQMPQVGTELRVRYSWQALPSDAPAAEAEVQSEEGSLTTLVLSADALQEADRAVTRELGNLRRVLLRRFGGSVIVQEEVGTSVPSKGPVLRVERGVKVLLGATEGLGIQEATELLQDNKLPSRSHREVTLAVMEGQCVTSAEDWIPGAMGLRVLADMRNGQRSLVRLAPDLLSPYNPQWLEDVGVPAGSSLEYDVELLQIMTLQDVSLDKSGRVMKKITREEGNFDQPVDGAEVTIHLEVREDPSGAVLVEEQELTFLAGNGKYCSAIEETVLTMKQGQVCEVRCTDEAACTDRELGLKPVPGGTIVIQLELVKLQKLDLYGSEDSERVAHCSGRKEAGTTFFQQGNWHQALKRYQHVTSHLAYLESWKEEGPRSEAVALRKACHLNAAACWLKLEEWREAERECSEVLKEEPGNLKALFRRGQALASLREFREAEQSFRKVLELDKENKEAARMLQKLRQSARQELEQQKEMFSRMAKGIRHDNDCSESSGPMAAADNEPTQAEPIYRPTPRAAEDPANGQGTSLAEDDDDWSDLLFWGLTAVAVVGAAVGLGMAWRRRQQ